MRHPGWPLRLGRALYPYGAALLDLIYPPLCLGCDRYVPDAASPLCHRCLLHLERADSKIVQDRLSRLPAGPLLDGASALWIFDRGGRLQRVQHALKYGNRPRYGRLLGRMMARALDLPAFDVIVPVPLHHTRYLERGYNQSGTLGRGLADVLNVPLAEHALARHRPTRSQTHLDRPARWLNVHDAFCAACPEDVRNRKVLLVDDVLTTGATVAAAARALREGGALHVHLATLALTRE